MTYQTKQRNYKNRVELIMSIAFLIGVNICYAITSYYFEGANFWDAFRQALYGTFMLVLLTLLGLPLIIACLAIGKLLKRTRNNNSR